MLEIIGVFLSVLMVAIIVVAIQDCVVKMWGSVAPKNNQNDQLAKHSQEAEFLMAQSQAVAAERDRTIDAQSNEIKHLHFALTERYNSIEELREKFQDLIQTSRHAEETIRDHKAQIIERDETIDGLKYKFETRGGQSPDLNTAWHMKETPVDVKQKYLLDDTPLDDNGSGVIDSQPYGE